jgi:putative DNA primase/helicase
MPGVALMIEMAAQQIGKALDGTTASEKEADIECPAGHLDTPNPPSSGEVARSYAHRGWPVFPCRSEEGPERKRPLTEHGFHDSAHDERTIRAWWRCWPDALIGVPTGCTSGFVVLDIDVKYDDANGYDTLEDLGFAVLPNTPMVLTPSGGLHIYFSPPEHLELRCTEGERGRGIGLGLDWRGTGGYVIVPSPGSGYSWDPSWNFDTVALAPVPVALLPRDPERSTVLRPVRPTSGLSPYAEAALDNACQRIITAAAGEQEATINRESFAIGGLAGAGAVPAGFARRTLQHAAGKIRDYDQRRPWRATEIANKVNRAFDAGMCRPRGVRRAG